jgi:hypothetical protein
VYVANHVGVPQVQLVIALIDEHPLRVQHRPDRSVEEDERIGIEQTTKTGGTRGHTGLGSGAGGRMEKYLASGWCTTIAAVDCSGTS